VKSTANSDIDEFYLYAQLVADSAEEAAALVQAALAERQMGHQSTAHDLVAHLWKRRYPAVRPGQSGSWLALSQVPETLDSMLPQLMSRLHPSRRLAIVSAYRDRHDSSEKDVFLLTVKRALESDHLSEIADRVSPEALESSMQRYIDTQLRPVPDALRHALRKKNAPASEPQTSEKTRIPFSARIAASLLIILLSAAVGSWITSAPTSSPTTRSELFDDLARRTVGDVDFRTSDPEQVERFIADRLDWQLRVPQLENGALQGLSTMDLGSGLRIPVIHYDDLLSGGDLLVSVLDYRFLDRARDVYLIDERILNQIAEERAVDIRNAPDFFRVTWRYRDDIYMAMTGAADAGLRNRFRFD
jgi:hypothetical protein